MPLAPHLAKLDNWGHTALVESRATIGSAFPSTAGAVPAGEPKLPVEQQWAAMLLADVQGHGSAGVAVTPKTVLGASTVFACVDLLASSIATLPLNVYRRTNGNGREIAREHPLFDLLHNSPNSEMDAVDFRKAMQANLCVHGNAYAIITRTRFGEVISLTPVDAKDVELRRDPHTTELRYRIGSSEFGAGEIMHLRGLGYSGLEGLRLTSTLSDVFGLAIALDRNAATFFKNQSMPGGFLEHPGKLSPEAASRLTQSFQGGATGSNAYKVKLLEEGLKYNAARIGNRDSQFDESRDRQGREIARIFRVPGHKVGIVDSQPRANVEQENLSFVIDTLRPLAVQWEQCLNRSLLSPTERKTHFVEFNLAGLLRGSLKERYEAYATARNWGWLSVNEIRQLENLNPIGAEGDVYLQPLNMAPAGQPQQIAEPPAAAE